MSEDSDLDGDVSDDEIAAAFGFKLIARSSTPVHNLDNELDGKEEPYQVLDLDQPNDLPNNISGGNVLDFAMDENVPIAPVYNVLDIAVGGNVPVVAVDVHIAALAGNAVVGIQSVSENEGAEDSAALRVRRVKKRPEPKEWKRNCNKKLRMQGQSYLGFSKPAGGKSQQVADRGKRKMGEDCKSKACIKSSLRECSTFSADDRKTLFAKFWGEMNWDQRKTFVTSHVDYVETKRQTVDNDSRRTGTYQYSLHLGADKKNVCQAMFLSTTGMGKWSVHNWAKEEHGMSQSAEMVNETRREINPGNRQSNNRIHRAFVKTFFEMLPKVPSHYCRKDTSKLYLEPGVFRSKSDLFTEYERKCVETGNKAVSRFTFDSLFIEANLLLFNSKKDQCDTCCQHEVGNLSDADWNEHVLKKEMAREEKKVDKEKSLKGECHVITMDLQAVKLAPFLQASALYYKTKLCVHNFTIFNLGTRHTTNFIWNEAECDLVASAFASCVIDYLDENHPGNSLPIIIYSDGCTYQNRNAIMANALLHYAVNNGVVVTQKFLEKGHTQMECDSVHAALERKLKNRSIYLPTDYVAVSNEARKKTGTQDSYNTKYLTHDFFKDYSLKKSMRYDSIRPGRMAKDPTVTNLRVIQYNPDGVIQVGETGSS